MKTSPPLERLRTALRPGHVVRTQNLTGGARGHVLARLCREGSLRLVCVTADEAAADTLAEDLSFFIGEVLRLPGDETTPYDEASPDVRLVAERLGALHRLATAAKVAAVVMSVRALSRRHFPLGLMRASALSLRKGEERGRDDLARTLDELGYRSSPLVEDVGTFSVRGDLIDLFPPLSDGPVRVELFGDTIDSLRLFDPQTQRTLSDVAEVLILPARELLLSSVTRPCAEAALREAAEHVSLPSSVVRERIEQLREGVLTYGLEPLFPALFPTGLSTAFEYVSTWSDRIVLYVDDPIGVERAREELWKELAQAADDARSRHELLLAPEAHYLTPAALEAALSEHARVEGGGLALTAGGEPPIAFGLTNTADLREEIRTHHGEEGALTPLTNRLSRWRDAGYAAVIACGTLGQADRLRRLLADRGLVTRTHDEALPADPGRALFDAAVAAHLFPAELSAGFVDEAAKLAVVADRELFGVRARRRVGQRRGEQPFTASFKELKEGDLVVHSEFGVARYGGLRTMEVNGLLADFLLLHYAGRDKVYLPVSRLRLVQKFTGGDPSKVALDRLGSGSWERTKRRVKEHLLQMAAELLRLYAARRAHPGHAFSPPDAYFRQFEEDFEFEATVDQQKAIDDVLADMQRPEPMDRLVCGDVGYGKTEVAIRAAFKAVLDKKQVAVLVPTTVLAQQHFLTFSRRMKDYPVRIDVISRMRPSSEVREVLRTVRAGGVDVLIGTHRLLASDVSFKDLGLIIVDEEQRFGVKHKEQLKELRTQVDVLTLTATPIPRTLNMAMAGIRDMSIIATPPLDRRSIRTFVIKFDPAQIKEAIVREVQRGGQVFFVHNRVSSIYSMERFLRELVPQVSFGVAHGQMREGELERVMVDFVERRFQVLISTTIIESGIDIPSANTMIVNRADAFGLAQLYQLRGRVGRSSERAYAYLLVPPRRTLTKDAQRRLEVLQAFGELGAGFSIASHDLEIRGAGNLLGPDQSGAIEAIGFDLYAQLLDEAIHEMRGEPPPTTVEPDVNLPMAALIPELYVPDVHQRLLLYKRFSMAATPEELDDLRAELVDRFGELPPEVENLTELMLLKIDLRDLRLRALEAGPSRLILTLGPDARLDGAQLAALVARSRGVYRLTPELKLIASVPSGLAGAALLTEAKKVLRDLGLVSSLR